MMGTSARRNGIASIRAWELRCVIASPAIRALWVRYTSGAPRTRRNVISLVAATSIVCICLIVGRVVIVNTFFHLVFGSFLSFFAFLFFKLHRLIFLIKVSLSFTCAIGLRRTGRIWIV